MLILQFCDGWRQYRNISHTQQAARPTRLQPHSRMPSDAGTHARRLLLLLLLMMVVDDMSRLLPGRTAANTSELWTELAGGTTLLLPVVVAVATVATRRTVGTLSASGANGGGTRRTNGTFVCCGDDLRWEVEPNNTYVLSEY